jgi:tetratricopeptide (TPR) repeat protein
MQMIDQEPVKAQNDFHKALQIDPTFTAVHYWLAEIALELQSYNEAISEADAFLAQNTNDADTLLLRANAEQRLGQVDKARADGTLALKQYRIANDSSGEARAQSFLSSLGH